MRFFISALTILFIYLKMTNQIDWSWLWILSPIWISFSICLIAFGAIVYFVKKSKSKRL